MVYDKYKSPIQVEIDNAATSVTKEIENYVIKCIHNVCVDVDRDELIKALEYDRKQYQRGFRDGYDEAMHILDYNLCKREGDE